MGEPTHRLDIFCILAAASLLPSGLSEGGVLRRTGWKSEDGPTSGAQAAQISLASVCRGADGRASLCVFRVVSVREKWIFLDEEAKYSIKKAVCDGPTFCRPNNE